MVEVVDVADEIAVCIDHHTAILLAHCASSRQYGVAAASSTRAPVGGSSAHTRRQVVTRLVGSVKLNTRRRSSDFHRWTPVVA